MTKKIRLDMDALAVESYVTSEQPPARGTVRGHLTYTDPRACAHTADWHCTVNELYCTHPDVCYLTTREHNCNVGID